MILLLLNFHVGARHVMSNYDYQLNNGLLKIKGQLHSVAYLSGAEQTNLSAECERVLVEVFFSFARRLS